MRLPAEALGREALQHVAQGNEGLLVRAAHVRARALPAVVFQVHVCASNQALHLTLLCATDGVRSKHWDIRFFQIIGTDLVVRLLALVQPSVARARPRFTSTLATAVAFATELLACAQWGVDREEMVNEVGLKRFDLIGCRVELRSEDKASSKGYRPRFKLVHPDRTLTFEVPSNGVAFAEIKEAVAAWSAVLMSAIEKANMGAEGAALRAAQSRSPEEAAALAERLMSQYDPDFAPQFDVDEEVDFHDATPDSLQDTVTAVFEGDGALGMSLVAQEIRSHELPPGWSQTQEEDGRVVYLMPGGKGRQYERPKAHEYQSVQIQGISPTGLVGTGQYFEKHSSQVDFLQVGMVLDALNGESVAGVSFKKIMERIKAAGRPVELTFHMPIDGQPETLTPRRGDTLQSFGERRSGPETAPARSVAQFNRTVGLKTGGSTAQSSMVSFSAHPARRVRASTAGPADYDDPKDDGAGASDDDDDYVDASTELQSFRSLQGSAEMLVSKLMRMLLPAEPHLAHASCCPAFRLLCCGLPNALDLLHHCRTKRLRCFT